MTLDSPIPAASLPGPAGPEAFDSEFIARIANDLFRGPEQASPLPAASPWQGPPAAPALPTEAAPGAFYFLDEAAASRPASAPGWTLAPSYLERTEPPRLDLQGPFDPVSLRRDFPILEQRVHGKPLVWLDNAATTQKPRAVLDRISDFYRHEYSNIHRAAHALAARSTDAYEGAREKARRFLNAASAQEIVFVRGATEAINLVAQSWGRRNLGPGDEIVITWLEHHANIVPWQQLAAEKGALLRVAPIDDQGQVRLDEYEKLLTPRTRLVAFAHVSNALGTVNPVQEMAAMAHRHGAVVLVDGAQSVSHLPVDVQALGADFYAFSGHKVFGPSGIGVLYGRSDLLEAMPPWQGGGNMIADVTFERTVFQPPPARFEAGTGNIADAVGLGAALDYVTRVGLPAISRHEHDLLAYATEGLSCIQGLRIIGTAREKAGVLSFVLDGFRSEEVGAALDREGIALRSGHHCAQPALRRFGVETSVRPSFALYNTRADIDALVAAVRQLNSSATRSYP
jgi:cysteine desulfurase/selenocysteine lyase